MQMSRVAETLEALGATTKRGEITRLLGELLREAPPEEVDKLIYLLNGRLGPAFEPLEFGVNERFIVRALVLATGAPVEQVKTEYRRKGDLGLVGEQLMPGKGTGLPLTTVYAMLREIAEASGIGAQERKIGLLADLLKQLGGKEARYVLRIVQGRLRLGVGDATVMDAVSWAAAGDASLRPEIERAFNLSSDLGMVARALKLQGVRGLQEFHSEPGKPIRPELAERLSAPADAIAKLGRLQAEPKYDGLRLQLHKKGDQVRFFTRRLEDVTPMFPELARAALRQMRARQAIVDGEAIVYNPETGEYLPFQTTVRRKRKYGIEEMEERYPLRLFVFDLLYADGKDHTQEPLAVRRQALDSLVDRQAADPLQLTESLVTGDAKELGDYFDEMVERGLEGLVVKRLNAPYQAGQRNFTWVKLKRGYRAELRDTVDVVVLGYLSGRGKRARFGIGSLLAGVYDPTNDRFVTVTKIGSGLTDAEWDELRRLLDEAAVDSRPPRVVSLIEPDVWVEPRYVLEVQADEITRSPIHTCGKTEEHPGYALRFPRVVRFRFDRAPEDATTEREILNMYRLQRRIETDARGPSSEAA